MDKIQKFIETARAEIKMVPIETDDYLTKALDMLAVMLDAILKDKEARESPNLLGDDEALDKALQRCEQIAGDE